MPKLDSARKQEIIDHLVGNCECGDTPKFSQDDVEVLNKFELEDLLKLQAEETQEPQAEVQNSEPAEVEAEVKSEPSFDESILPDSVQEELAFARNMLQQKKDEYIEVIVANENCDFTKDELQARDHTELGKLAKLAKVVENSVVEQPEEKVEEPAPATPRLGGHAIAANKASESGPTEVLDSPIMLFN